MLLEHSAFTNSQIPLTIEYQMSIKPIFFKLNLVSKLKLRSPVSRRQKNVDPLTKVFIPRLSQPYQFLQIFKLNFSFKNLYSQNNRLKVSRGFRIKKIFIIYLSSTLRIVKIFILCINQKHSTINKLKKLFKSSENSLNNFLYCQSLISNKPKAQKIWAHVKNIIQKQIIKMNKDIKIFLTLKQKTLKRNKLSKNSCFKHLTKVPSSQNTQFMTTLKFTNQTKQINQTVILQDIPAILTIK